jgi:hypothetical protein
MLNLLLASCTMIQPLPPQTSDDGWLIVRINYDSTATLNRIASELDIWEVDRTAQTLVARVRLDQRQWVLALGQSITLDCAKMRANRDALGTRTAAAQALIDAECPE